MANNKGYGNENDLNNGSGKERHLLHWHAVPSVMSLARFKSKMIID